LAIAFFARIAELKIRKVVMRALDAVNG